MLALENLVGTRVVARPDALDACIAALPPTMTALRFAHDEVLLVGRGQLELDDEYAIIEREVGFSYVRVRPEEFRSMVLDKLDWTMSGQLPVFGQGKLMGIPVKLYLTDDYGLVICATAYGHELQERLR